MLKGPEDQPRQLLLTISAEEYAALMQFRDQDFPGVRPETFARKLLRDGLVGAGWPRFERRTSHWRPLPAAVAVSRVTARATA